MTRKNACLIFENNDQNNAYKNCPQILRYPLYNKRLSSELS